MGRELRRVPVGFDWPLNEVWAGFITPEWLHEKSCPDCRNGYSSEAQRLFDQWYGNAPFDPDMTGSPWLTIDTPEVRAFAQRNVDRSPEFYGGDGTAVIREALRLVNLWNGCWSHHLAQADVDALVDGGRLWDFTRTIDPDEGWKDKEPPYRPTAAEVNMWSLVGFGHDSLNASIVIQARCERDGIPHLCASCNGHGCTEAFKGQRALAEAHENIDPPRGDGWQIWETVSEGSPVTPAFATAEELAEFYAREKGGSPEAVLKWLTGPGWSPSMIVSSAGVQNSDELIAGGTSHA